MIIKKCIMCNEEKPHKAKGYCNGCYSKIYDANNRESILEKRRSRYSKNQEKYRLQNKANNTKHQLGKKWVNNGIINKYVTEEELPEHIERGWIKGMLKRTHEIEIPNKDVVGL